MAENWAFLFDDDVPAQHFHGRGRAEFADGPFAGIMEATRIRPGIDLYRIDGRTTHSFALAPDVPAPTGALAMGFMLSGHGRVVSEGAEEQVWRDGQSFFALAPDYPVAYHVRPQKQWQIVSFVVEREALADLAKDNDLPSMARASLAGRSEPFSHLRPLGRQRAALIARELLQPIYVGGLEALHREAKALELLTHQLEMLGGLMPRSGQLSLREQMRVREARERLTADLRDPPRLRELADAVGLTPRKLNHGFRDLYGVTVFEYLRDARLDAAHDMLLQEGTALPLKQLAWRVGYSQATNFITAYRRRFGVSPGHRRKLHGAED
jgi:AraC-like DNA-binding protein